MLNILKKKDKINNNNNSNNNIFLFLLIITPVIISFGVLLSSSFMVKQKIGIITFVLLVNICCAFSYSDDKILRKFGFDEDCDYHSTYMNCLIDVISLSQKAINRFPYIVTEEEYKENILLIQGCYNYLSNIIPPTKYREKHYNILSELERYI